MEIKNYFLIENIYQFLVILRQYLDDLFEDAASSIKQYCHFINKILYLC